MTKTFWKVAGVAAMASGLAACGGGGGTTAAAPPPVVVPPVAAPLEDQFGAGFGVAYRGAPNTDPARDPVAGDLIPLSLTTEAVTL